MESIFKHISLAGLEKCDSVALERLLWVIRGMIQGVRWRLTHYHKNYGNDGETLSTENSFIELYERYKAQIIGELERRVEGKEVRRVYLLKLTFNNGLSDYSMYISDDIDQREVSRPCHWARTSFRKEAARFHSRGLIEECIRMLRESYQTDNMTELPKFTICPIVIKREKNEK